MNQDDFRALKESGGLVDDAGLQEELTNDREEEELKPDDEQLEEQEQEEQEEPEDIDDDLPPLSEKEKTAFEKRMERERTKERERLEAEYKQKYARHDEVITMLGGDPDAIEKRIRDNQLAAQAQNLADVNGWDEDQTQWYINDQRQKQEVKEMRVQIGINKLSSNPDYAGIASMEKEILSKIDKTNGALSVEEAYWALGGPKKAEQIRLEAQVRESVKRQKQPRTVLTDSQISTTSEKPLPADVVRDAERMGISVAEARRLMSQEPAKDLNDFRSRKKAK